MRSRTTGTVGKLSLMAMLAAAAASGQVTESVIHSFPSPTAFPLGTIARDAAGNLYGVSGGGKYLVGVAFKIDSSGNYSVLHTFTHATDGGYPNGVSVDAAGNVYGTTPQGGKYASGTVFEIDSTGRFSVLYSFTGGADGGHSQYGVTPAAGSMIYGTTPHGGGGAGEIYSIDSSGNYTTVYSFSNGALPFGTVTLDGAGNIYGTLNDGTFGDVVYKLDPAGNLTWLHVFPTSYVPINPGLVLDAAGNLYGTTQNGGITNAQCPNGCGVVFKVNTSSGQETDVYDFPGGAAGGNPNAGVLLDATGNLYGTCANGGANQDGVVFELDPTGNETVLYSFARVAKTPAPFPPFTSGLVRDSDGNLYGAFALTKLPAPGGVVYKINATNQYSVLHQFRFNADGFDPQPGLVLDAAGNLYGTTTEGGPANSGVIYKIDSTGAETVLYQFPGGTKGSYPYGGVIADAAGNLYGTTLDAPPGPPTTAGEVYELSAGQKTVLAKAGPTPYGRVARDASGNFYWTNFRSWILDCGAVLKLDGSGNRTVLWEFGKYLPDGCRPYYGVTLDAAGNLYGTTHDGVGSGTNHVGTVYKIDASGRYSQLHVFTGGADGGSPSSGLIIDAAGNMYGATARGGTYNHGVVYKIDPSGNETTLYSFTGGADGDNPSALAFGPAGSFYGTAQYGGNLSACGFPYAPYAGCGVVFKLDAAGNQTVLYAFSGVDGALPSSLVTDGSGNLYGTADYGGTKGGGVVFELTGAVR